MKHQTGDSGKIKLGFLGGTFNPIHNGHIAAARQAIETLGLHKVVFLPNSTPPHKSDDRLLPFETRYRLIEESIESYPDLEVSDLDNTLDAKSYTYHLVQRLRKVYPNAEFFFIIGEDNIRSLESWYEYRKLLDEITFAVVTRSTEDTPTPDKPDYYDRLVHLPMQPVDVSSTEIRERVRKGEDIAGMAPKPVEEYLSEAGFTG